MKKALLTATAIALPLTTMAATTVSAETLRLRYSQWIPSAHFTQKNGLHVFFKEVAKATEGRVRITPTAKGLGPPPRQMQLAADGIADVAWGAHGYQPGVYPLSEIAELPGITRNAKANSVAYWKVFKAMFEKTGMHLKDVVTLAVHVHPAGQVYNNKRAIMKSADFKGLKLRATNSTVFFAFQSYGAVPISPVGGVTALHQGLSKGIMDGTSFTDEALFNFRVSKFIKHGTHFNGGIYNTSFYLVMNARKWSQISAKDQTAIMSLAGARLAEQIGAMWDKQETDAGPKLAKQGIKVIKAPAALQASMDKTMAPIRAKWIAKAKKKSVDGEAAIRMFKAEIAKVN